jgi:hypothetical protein
MTTADDKLFRTHTPALSAQTVPGQKPLGSRHRLFRAHTPWALGTDCSGPTPPGPTPPWQSAGEAITLAEYLQEAKDELRV